MKIQLIIAFAGIFICSQAFGQKKDAEILEYISHQEGLVVLTDLPNLAVSVMPYQEIIKEYLAKNNLTINDYYVWTSQIQKNNSTLTIPIHHYDGFKLRKELEDQNTAAYKARKEGELYMVKDFDGNASGKDGSLEIDLRTKKVSFSLWQ